MKVEKENNWYVKIELWLEIAGKERGWEEIAKKAKNVLKLIKKPSIL